MNIYALDKDFQLVTTAIPYTVLQWYRKYYEAGQFQMTIPLDVFDDSWAYIGTTERGELGMVEKHLSNDTKTITVSGFFCEKMLDKKVCYPRYIGDVQKTETAIRNIFTKYKGDLPIELADANDPLLGDRTQSDFSDDELGKKLYRILESRELSYRVRYDYIGNQLYLEVWQGLDRTQSQNVNPCQTFSLEFGNILKRTVDMDSSAYKNYAIIPVNGDSNNKERDTFYLDLTNGEDRREIVIDMRANQPEENQSYAAFKAGIMQEALEKMLSKSKIEDVDIDTVGDLDYMYGYDLGDKCDVVLSDLNITMETRITEVLEVFKANSGHTVTVGLGNKRIANMRKAVI